MQAVVQSSAAIQGAGRFHFFALGRDYMMRSEKRSGGSPLHSAPAPGGRPPKKRRRAGFFYKLCMLILLLVLWPLGLMMLWRRKLRWSLSTKLLTSIVTLAACIVLFGFALTVNTHNATYTQVQDSINGFLDDAADSLIDFGKVVRQRGEIALEGAQELGALIQQQEFQRLADALDWSAQQGRQVRDRLAGLFDSEDSGQSENAEPDSTGESTPAPTASASPSPTPRIVEERNVRASDDTLPVYIPSATADASTGHALGEGILERLGNLEAGPLPTPKPTPEPVEFAVKPAADAIVYYNDSGKYYHMTTVCGSMKSAHAHRFEEVLESGHLPCNSCGSPALELLEETYIVWVDEGQRAHLSDECELFNGNWQLMSVEDALEAGCSGCSGCGSDQYLHALIAGKNIAVVAPEATEEPESGEPSSADVSPRSTAKASATATPKPTSAPTSTASPRSSTPSATPDASPKAP